MDVRRRKLTTLGASSVLVLWVLKDSGEKRDCLSLSLLTAFLIRSVTLSGLSSSLLISQSYNFDTVEGTNSPRVECSFIIMQLSNCHLDPLVRFRGRLFACLRGTSECIIACL